MSQTNFLIGRGELLTHDIKGPKRKPGKAQAYTFERARERLQPQVNETAQVLADLPTEACPRDFAVARLTMNPSFIAKSYFPADLLRAIGLESVGSRTVRVKPERWTKKEAPRECATTELFVAGKRQAFRQFSQWMNEIDPLSDEAEDLTHIESFSSFLPDERVKDYGTKKDQYFEVGLHLLPGQDSAFIQSEFISFAKRCEITVHDNLSFTAGTL